MGVGAMGHGADLTGSAGSGMLATPALVPVWVGVLGALVFLAVLVAHLRHALQRCPTPRRSWHMAHVLMAASMVTMYLPPDLDPVGIPTAAWRAMFLLAPLILAVSGLVQLGERRGLSALWLLVAVDLAAMLYMWTPGATSPALSLLLGLLLSAEAVLWASARAWSWDRALGPQLWSLDGGGVIGVGSSGAADGLSGPLELRVSMVAMSLGMGYMILAMALMS